MEKEFIDWFESNEKRFDHGQFDEKQIAYSAWLEGKQQVKDLNIPAAVMGELNCDNCGCHPNIIYQTSKGRFCEKCSTVK